ncbi:dihydrofolate reductase [Patescibacteria group bacterium]|nr:dihydrofolate reductase [Patescibacteria group bacterium]MBU1703642.1 dihydrofolate reductase [Patescibacteria group bacterium]MBU1954251.1 dihydrofolate reductase [Patescibacteria group bacterium]
MKKFSIIVAADEKMGIGKDNALPWPRLKEDMKYFADVTTRAAAGMKNAVIMGRKTWESIPAGRRPLEGRLNVVLSRGSVALPEGVLLFHSLEDALADLSNMKEVDQLFVIGGANVFEQALAHPQCEKIYLTKIAGGFECDTFLPPIGEDFRQVSQSAQQEDDGIWYWFEAYER